MESGIIRNAWKRGAGLPLCLFLLGISPLVGCGSDAPPMGHAIKNRDSIPVMITHGVSKLVTDSGIMRYKIIAEEWRVYDKTNPQRQEFPKGMVMQRFNNNFNVNLYVTADTAYCYGQNLWELRGRAFIRDFERGTTIRSEELFWDMSKHEIYSNVFTHVITPDRELKGYWFRSNEAFTKFHIKQSSGYMPMPENSTQPVPQSSSNTDFESENPDTLPRLHSNTTPRRKLHISN